MKKLISSTSLKYFFIVIAIIICQPFSSLASSQTSKQCDEVFQNAKWKEVGDEYSTNKKNSPKYLSRSDGSATKVDVLLENAFTPLLEKMANDVKAFDKTKLRQSIQARYRNTSQYRPIPYVHRSFPATQFKKLATILNEIGSLANEDIPWQDFDKSPNRYWKVPGHNHTFYYAKNAYQAYLDYKSGKTQSIIVVPKNYKKIILKKNGKKLAMPF